MGNKCYLSLLPTLLPTLLPISVTYIVSSSVRMSRTVQPAYTQRHKRRRPRLIG